MEPRTFNGGGNHDTASDQLLGSRYNSDRVQYHPDPSSFVQAGDNFEVDNANLRSQIEDLESKLAEELEATRDSIRLRESAAKADQEMIKKLQISNNEADQLIEKLDEKINRLRTERNDLRDNKEILAGDKEALENEKKSLEAKIESLQEEKQDLETRVSDLLVGRNTLRKQINVLGKEVLLTKEKAEAYSQKVKDLSLEF
jgi:chromosome segregation ATPase